MSTKNPDDLFGFFLNLGKFLLSALKRLLNIPMGWLMWAVFFVFLTLDFEESLENDSAVSGNVWNWMPGCIKKPSLTAVLLYLGLWLVQTPQI